jgi:hypothetical protein
MHHLLLYGTLLFAAPVLAQTEDGFLNAHAENAQLDESLQPTLEYIEQEVTEPVDLRIEDIDDLSAHVVLTENIELFATAANLFDINMVVDRYDEDQLTDIEPAGIDDIYPVPGTSRSIVAGIRFTF